MDRVGAKSLAPGGGRYRLKRATAVLLLAVSFGFGCGAAGDESGSGRLQVVATTSVIQDLVRQVGGERVEASTIVPVGGSPETFQPSPRDAARVSEAAVVFENGHGLDSWVEDLVESAGGEGQKVVELSRGLEPVSVREHGDAEHAHGHARVNPHFWLDVENAQVYVKRIRDALVEADPEAADAYRDNAGKYLAELGELDAYIREQTGSIPEKNRKLVTFHDAFPYFAEAYGLEQVAVVLRNPDAEPGSRQVARVVRKIQGENVPAIFTEPQFNSGLAETIAREAGVEVYELHSDTLTADREAGTYEDMMRANADRIKEALG